MLLFILNRLREGGVPTHYKVRIEYTVLALKKVTVVHNPRESQLLYI